MREDHFFCGAGQGAKLKIRKTGRTEPKNQQKCIIWGGGASIPNCDDDYHKDSYNENIDRFIRYNGNNAITDGGVAPPEILLTIVMMSSNLKSLRISRNSKDCREG